MPDRDNGRRDLLDDPEADASAVTQLDPFGDQVQPIGLTLAAAEAFDEGAVGYITKGTLVSTPANDGDTPLRAVTPIALGATVEVCMDIAENVYVVRTQTV